MPQRSKRQQLDCMAENSIFQPSASMANNPIVCLYGPKSTFNTRLHGREHNSLCHNGRDKIISCLAHSQLQTDSFSKSSNSRDHRFRAWHHSHSSPIFYLRFIMTIVIVISFAHECKLYPVLCTWSKSRIVQSPIKVNNPIYPTPPLGQDMTQGQF